MVTELTSTQSNPATASEAPRDATGPAPDRTDRTPSADSAAAALAPLLRAMVGTDVPVRFEFWDGSAIGPTDGIGTLHIRSADAIRRYRETGWAGSIEVKSTQQIIHSCWTKSRCSWHHGFFSVRTAQGET